MVAIDGERAASVSIMPEPKKDDDAKKGEDPKKPDDQK